MNILNRNLTAARINCLLWIDQQVDPTGEVFRLTEKCYGCPYVCKHRWMLQGEIALSGRMIRVGPFCQVLRLFEHPNRFPLPIQTATLDLLAPGAGDRLAQVVWTQESLF